MERSEKKGKRGGPCPNRETHKEITSYLTDGSRVFLVFTGKTGLSHEKIISTDIPSSFLKWGGTQIDPSLLTSVGLHESGRLE